MAALNVKRHWWTRQTHPGAPEAPLFRVLAHRWQPVVRKERKSVPLHFALALEEEQKVNHAHLGSRRRVVAANDTRPRWSPWMWVKST
jgi:hypothetical protein